MLLAQHLRQNRVTEFNAREVRRQIGGMLREAADMEAACKQLVEAGLIRPRFTRAGEVKGRKSQSYEVHPEVAVTALLPLARFQRDLPPCAGSAISANSSENRPNGTNGTNGTGG